MKTTTIKSVVLAAACTLFGTAANAQAITENFDNITTLPGSGWVLTNNSNPVGSTSFTQGPSIGGGGPFDAFNGAADSYLSMNYNNTSGAGTISTFLISPNRTFRNGDVVTFYTRKASPDTYPDRLEVRISTNGASSAVGAAGTGVGDFTTLLMSVNPSLVTGVYPLSWTQYTITISGLSAPTSGRLAFRYFVTNGGPTGANSDFIGIDAFQYTPYVCPTLTISPASVPAGTAGVAYSSTYSQTGALGTPFYGVTAGALPAGLSLSTSGVISGSPTVTGTFNYTVTVADASGCNTSSSYALTVGCPTITVSPASVAGAQATVPYSQSFSNTGAVGSTTYSTTGTLPPGLSLSGGGILNGAPTALGTYNFDVVATDANGCTGSTSYSITVSCPPNSATFAALSPVCSNAGMVTLSGGSPAGGVYSGTGVSGGMFDPAVGSQTITYTYIDGFGCTNTATSGITVNTAPTVTQTPFTPVCVNSPIVSLSGASPAGGVYSGTGVTGTDFDPAAGTQLITYTYTDMNGCTASASETQVVNSVPTIILTLSPLCDNSGTIMLMGGSPAGGIYSGTGVSAGMFDAAAGTQSVTYTYTDANGCTGFETQTQLVNTAPVVTQSPFSTVCIGTSPVVLTGGSPAGGMYSGTNVSGGSFDPIADGTFAITYTVTDMNGCTGMATENIIVDLCTGIATIGQEGQLLCYPNPATGSITVSLLQNTKADLTVRLITLQGQVVRSDVRPGFSGLYSENIDLTQLAKGTYLVEVNNGTSMFRRIVVQ
jgi:hypothetical protein